MKDLTYDLLLFEDLLNDYGKHFMYIDLFNNHNLEAHWRNFPEVTDVVNKRAGTQVLD